MIPEAKLEEFRGFLRAAERPLFLFDDDPDGLCSFLLLQRFCQKGVGIPTSHKGEDSWHSLLAEVSTYAPDLIVFLDVAVLEKRFLSQLPCRVLHLDHHPPLQLRRRDYFYYNPRLWDDQHREPTSYWAYHISQGSLWVAMVGMVADWFPFLCAEAFRKEYPSLLPPISSPGEAYFDTPLGQLVKIFAFVLKGKREDVQSCITALLSVGDPFEILEQKSAAGKRVFQYAQGVLRRYERRVQDAMEMHASLHGKKEEWVFVYTYADQRDSFTSLLSNELIYRLPEELVLVGRVKEGETVMSVRSRTVALPERIASALQGLHGHGGGHDNACGAMVRNSEFSLFVERLLGSVRLALECEKE